MKAISKLDEVEEIFLEDLVEDYEGIWTLADRVSEAIGIQEPAAVREVTLRLVRDLLVSGMVRIGVPEGDTPRFDAWPEKGEEAAEKVASEWREIERLPLLGDITWFAITPQGERLVRERQAARR